MKITSQKFAGQRVWLGDGQVEFGPDGDAQGVVKGLDGRPITPPAPVGASQVEVARASASYAVVGDDDALDAPDAPDDAAEAATAVEDAPAAPESPAVVPVGTDGGDDTPEPGNALSEAPSPAGEDAGGADEGAALDGMTKVQLYKWCGAHGIDAQWVGSSRDDLLELARTFLATQG